MIVLAFDPHPDRHAWGAVMGAHEGYVYVGHGVIPCRPSEVKGLLCGYRPALVVVEQAYIPTRNVAGNSVLETAYRAGGVLFAAEELGLPAATYQKAQWARVLCRGVWKGRGTPPAKAVQVVLGRLLRGMPARTNDHTRDALGLALAASLIREGWR